MHVFNNLNEVDVRKAVVTMGTFDGLHCGHRLIINQLLQKAKALRKPSMVITFEPHPRLVLQNNIKNLKLLTDKEEKISLLAEMGVDYLLILPFTYEFSQQTSVEFIENYLILGLGISSMVIGYDHRFGRSDEQQTDVSELLHERGIDVERIPQHDIENVAVSSTKIRKSLADGDIHAANKLLGYAYTMSGAVIHGYKIGRKLDFPTANILLRNNLKLIPTDGVYAVEVKYRMKWHKGMMNIGHRPTFGIDQKALEVHIFDFDEIIYGEFLTIRFIEKIRDEIVFSGPEELRIQLQKDKQNVEQIFDKQNNR
ncbi:MAG: bifunctional riboflavin kinase/FAD synthetase [Bacteroidales bacterium]|nr:bifunctional riboflavin kinase/FAD synthetase [Bacteroidales bacterium]